LSPLPLPDVELGYVDFGNLDEAAEDLGGEAKEGEVDEAEAESEARGERPGTSLGLALGVGLGCAADGFFHAVTPKNYLF